MFTACTHSARITRLHVLQKSYMGEDTPPAYLCPNQTLGNTYMYGILDHGFVGQHLK